MHEVVARRPQGTPCWVSLLVHDLPAAQEFYGGMFGWRFRPGPRHFGPYTRAVLDELQVAGVGTLPEWQQLPVAWTPYLTSEDADATAELIREHCGTVAVGPLDADDNAGRMLIAADPGGAVFGVWEPRELPGSEATGVPGTVAWHELVTRNDGFVSAFYSAVFGYKVEPTPASCLERSTLLVGDRPVAGVSSVGDELPRGVPPHWMTYFTVADTDAAARGAVRLGGRVVRGPWESPFGRAAVVADPEGAAFTVVQSPEPV